MNDFLSYGSRQILQIDLQLITIPRKEGRGGCTPGLLALLQMARKYTGPGTPVKKDQEMGE